MNQFTPPELQELSGMISEHAEAKNKRTAEILNVLLENIAKIFGGR